MQRKSKIRNKVMVVVEFIVQRNGLAILASYNSRAFIVAELICRANLRHRGKVRRNILILLQAVLNSTIRQAGNTINFCLRQFDVFIKHSFCFNRNGIIVEFNFGTTRLINIPDDQRIFRLHSADVVGNQHRMTVRDLKSRNRSFTANMIAICMQGGIFEFAEVCFIINPDNLFRSSICVGFSAVRIAGNCCCAAIARRSEGDHIDFIVSCIRRADHADLAVIISCRVSCCVRILKNSFVQVGIIVAMERQRLTILSKGIRIQFTRLVLNCIVNQYKICGIVPSMRHFAPVNNFCLDFVSNRCFLQIVRDNLICRFKGFPRLAIVAGILPSFAPVTNARDIRTGRYRRLIDARGVRLLIRRRQLSALPVNTSCTALNRASCWYDFCKHHALRLVRRSGTQRHCFLRVVVGRAFGHISVCDPILDRQRRNVFHIFRNNGNVVADIANLNGRSTCCNAGERQDSLVNCFYLLLHIRFRAGSGIHSSLPAVAVRQRSCV